MFLWNALYRTPDGPHVMSPEIRHIITELVLNIFMFEDYCLLGCDAIWSGTCILKLQRNLLSGGISVNESDTDVIVQFALH